MRSSIKIVFFSFLLAATGYSQPVARYVVMISVDGLRPAEYLGAGSCETTPPTLRSLMQSGVYSRGVTGVLPTLTYPSHATLATGTYPTKHGVLNNVRARDGADWYYDRSDIHVGTIWDAARKAGLSVGIVTWPSTYGADVNYLIPEDLSGVDTVAARIRRGSTPGLFDTLQKKTGNVKLVSFDSTEAGIPLDKMTASFAVEIVRRYKPNLMMLHFLDLDHREHNEGVGSAGACASLQRIDAQIAQIRSAYASAGILDQTTFFIVSDHGFFPLHTIINVRELLAQSGWSAVVHDPMESTIEVRGAGGSAAIYLKAGADSSLIARLAKDLRPRLESRFRGLVRWISPQEAQNFGGFPGAAFVLCASPGYSLSGSNPKQRNLFISAGNFVGTHGYCPDEQGIEASFIASGAGIRAFGEIPRIRMIDIAPTVAALLGIQLPDAEGSAIAGILKKPQ
jgi:predicted AlkP superfamily pyrophosphatase or phosphodiesterase